MKKILLLTLLVCVVVSLTSIAACAEPEPAPAPSPAPTTPAPPTPTPPAPEVVELTYATAMPPQSGLIQYHIEWINKVQEISQGQIKIELIAGGALLATQEIGEGVQTGVADMGLYVPSELEGQEELGGFVRLPFIPYKSWYQQDLMYREIFNLYPELQTEYSENNMYPYCMRVMPPAELMTSKVQVRVPADIKGMKLYATGEVADLAKAAGAAPVVMGAGEWYTALDRGLIEGMFLHDAAALIFDLIKNLPYTLGPAGGIHSKGQVIIFNLDVWNSLPPEVQKVFHDTEAEFIEGIFVVDVGEIAKGKAIRKELGYTHTDLTPAELQEWVELAQPATDAWIADMASKGLPSQAVIDDVMRLIEVLPVEMP